LHAWGGSYSGAQSLIPDFGRAKIVKVAPASNPGFSVTINDNRREFRKFIPADRPEIKPMIDFIQSKVGQTVREAVAGL
jgi:predicted Zn-dependent protease